MAHMRRMRRHVYQTKKAQIERTVADKFPGPPEDAEAIPMHAELPAQDWRTGEVDW